MVLRSLTMLSRVAGSLSIIAFIAAMVIIARGWSESVETFVGPGGSIEKGTETYADTPKAKVDEAAAKGNIETLLRDAQFSSVGGGISSSLELTKSMKSSEPAIPVGEPIDSGGIVATIANGGSVAVFCARPAYYYCGATDLNTRTMGTAEAKGLAAARAGAIKATAIPDKPAQSPPPASGSGSGSDDGIDGAEGSILDQARGIGGSVK